MKKPRLPKQAKPAKQRPVLPEIWNGLVYADLLSKFTRAIEKLAISEVRTEKELHNDTVKKSQAKAVFDEGRQMIKDLNIDSPDVITAVSKIEGSAAAFEATHKSNVEQLRKLLPLAEDGAQMSWPPPVPAHLAINSFVSLALRIHTERPHIPADKVMLEAARTTILPVVAHWICISGPSGMPNQRAIRALDEAFAKESLTPPVRVEDPWARVATVMARAARSTFGDDADALLKEVRLLIAEHRQNPHGGRLWQQMGKLNGTPPGSNLLTLFECIRQLEPTEPPSGDQGRGASTLYCSRLRYEAVRLGHYDEDFKRIAAGEIREIERTMLELDKLEARTKLGMAFILSRLALISPGEENQAESERKLKLAELTIKLLRNVADGEGHSPKIKEVADRYLLGFMTNPRFAKPFNDTTELADRLEKYKGRHQTHTDSIPALLADVFDARLLWARALGGEQLDENGAQIIGLYARACEKLLVSIEEGARDVAFDSEAPVWILPEMSALVWMGDEHIDRPAIIRRLKQPEYSTGQADTTEMRKRFANASSILARIAETEFGIYYHQVYERTRILEGMINISKIAEATRRRKKPLR
jgi:hypothetical protein